MTLGVDTSVVVRLLMGEPAAHAALALRRLQEAAAAGSRLFVSDLVVAESYFALVHHYRVAPAEAIRQIGAFLRSSLVEPEPGGGALRAVVGQAPGQVGFVDRLIVARYRELGALVLTFDAAMGRLEGATRIG